MGDFTDFWVDLGRMFLVGIIMVAIVAGIGFSAGYNKGYDEGVTKCNNETIKEQLGY